jgi:hypothetical protein
MIAAAQRPTFSARAEVSATRFARPGLDAGPHVRFAPPPPAAPERRFPLQVGTACTSASTLATTAAHRSHDQGRAARMSEPACTVLTGDKAVGGS